MSEDDSRARPQPAPIRVTPDFEAEYLGSSRLASECMINIGVTWFSAIADHMLITRGGMTKALDALEKLDYVRRMPHPSDRRMLLVEITDTGMRIMNELLLRLHVFEKEWFDVLTPDQQRVFIELMGKVQARFQQLQRSFKP